MVTTANPAVESRRISVNRDPRRCVATWLNQLGPPPKLTLRGVRPFARFPILGRLGITSTTPCVLEDKTPSYLAYGELLTCPTIYIQHGSKTWPQT
jgi:hypothetical protein